MLFTNNSQGVHAVHGPFVHADTTVTVCMIIEAGGYNFLGASGCKLDKTHTIRAYHANGYVSDITRGDMLLVDGKIFTFDKFGEKSKKRDADGNESPKLVHVMAIASFCQYFDLD